MAITLGSNISALNVQRTLNQTDEASSRVFERLSTGLRINRASDDAAGLSVVSTLNAQSRIFARANLNISDAMSYLNVADGALNEVSSIVTRMQELSTQAVNGSLSLSQRNSLDKEYQQLDSEIRRIAGSTSFNGINLLSGGKRTNLSSKNLYTDSTNLILDASADGRFQSSASITTDQFTIHDSISGQTRQISGVSNGGIVTAGVQLQNGDLVFKYSDPGDGADVIARYNWSTGTTQIFDRDDTGQGIGSIGASADGSAIVWVHASGFSKFNKINTADGSKITSSGTFAPSTGSKLVVSENGRFAATSTIGSPNAVDFSSPTRANVLMSGILNQNFAGITNDGRIYLSSNQNPVGQNPGASYQLFSFDIGTSTIAQLTNYSNNSNQLRALSFSLDAGSIYFTNNRSLTGENPNSITQVFKFDIASRTTTQQTAFSTSQTFSVLSADGARAYISATGGGLDEYDISQDANTVDVEAGFGAQGRILGQIQSLFSSIRGLGVYNLQKNMYAYSALERAKENLESLSQSRGVIGAAMSRLQIASNLTLTQKLEAEAASARISNADIAQESARLVSTSILRQAGAAVLAQANQQPALALKLLLF